MKRFFSIPAIGLILSLLLASKLSHAQSYFTANVVGKGKPIIFIHGFYCSGDVWKEVVEHYQNNYECHILTLSGFGGNKPNLNDHFLESVKDDIITYTKAKHLDKPIVIGHSMGGYLSLWMAKSAPGLFGKIISVDGVPFFPALQVPDATVETSKPIAENMRKTFASQTPEQTLANQKMYLPMLITDTEKINLVAEIAAKADSKTQGQVWYEMYTTDLRNTLSSINCPVLVLGSWIAYKNYGATHDNVLKGFEEQVKDVRNCKVEICDTAKHFIFYDDKQWFLDKVDAFIKTSSLN